MLRFRLRCGSVIIVLGLASVCTFAVAVPADATSSPIGALDVVEMVPDPSLAPDDGANVGLRVAGWAIDPDSSSSTTAHIYLNGALIGVLDASRSRTDVAALYPAFGALHGFDGSLVDSGFPSLQLKFGDNTVCAYGIDAGTDHNALLGCRTVTAGRSPTGSLDVVTPLPGGHVRIAGWVIDPDVVRASGVHVWVDGAFKAAIHAAGQRSDVGTAFPVYGAEHGFDAELSNFTDGEHNVCVYGIDTGLRSGGIIYSPHPLLACRSITV